MNNHIFNIYSLLVALCCFCFSGCSSTDYIDVEQDDKQNSAIYLTLSISTSDDATRAYPNGGEDGDGEENGIYNEGKIEKLVLFFIEADDSKIDPTKFIDDTSEAARASEVIMEFCENVSLINQTPNSTKWTTLPIEIKNLIPGKEYYMIAVANVYRYQFSNIQTLGDLQDFEFRDKQWSSVDNIEEYNKFVMTSRFKSTSDIKRGKVTHTNIQSNPAQFSTSLERLAARVDIIPQTTTNNARWNSETNCYKYPVKLSGGSSTNDSIQLLGIQLINKNNQATYLLKHLAEPDATATQSIDYSTITRIGSEYLNSGKQANYVVDPTTSMKIGDKYPLWFDNYYDAVDSWYNVPQTTANSHYILDYTKENTLTREHQDELHYITSLSIKCLYLADGFTPGMTFYAFRNIKYRTLSDVAKAVNVAIGSNTVTELTVTSYPGVSTYLDGICYFTYQIKHANDNDDATKGIMEYGIVRNNIYRITINSFKGLGNDEPYIPVDITNNIDFNLWVVPWHIIDNPEIIL